MAHVQTRRSISFNRALFDQCREVAERLSIPASKIAEAGLRDILGCDDDVIIVRSGAVPSRKTPRVSKHDVLAVRRLLKSGATHNAIASIVGVTSEFVAKVEFEHGAMPQRGRPRKPPSMKVMKIRELLASGLSRQEVAKQLCCSRQYVEQSTDKGMSRKNGKSVNEKPVKIAEKLEFDR